MIKPLESSSLLICGVSRNCSTTIIADIHRLRDVFADAKNLQMLVIESDSTDDTVSKLHSLSQAIPGFAYESLGALVPVIPRRTDRIAHCRNRYLEIAVTDPKYLDVDYIAVVDLDGVISRLTKTGISSCWDGPCWDVCVANQDGPYYDIWALRHPQWCPTDCWQEYIWLTAHGLSSFSALWQSIYSRMITIPSSSAWVEVDSAFGGFAIYKKSILAKEKYCGSSLSGLEICEHVSVNLAIRLMGGRIYINPRLINGKVTQDARYRTLLGRLLLFIRIQFFGVKPFYSYTQTATLELLDPSGNG